jgi:LacI family transcriptional regulator
MKRTQVTLDDIAAKVSVSKVTVSKALRGHPDISSETVKKIKKAARELGYVPNYMARNLSSRRSNTIGVIVPKIAHFFFSSVIESIYDAAFEQNYEIILTVSQEDAEREYKHIQSLLSMRVDGLIISVSEQTTDPSIFKSVHQMGVPLTFMDRTIDIEGFNTVVVDDYGGSRLAIEHALQVGYRKLGHIGGFQHINIGRARYKGFCDVLTERGIPLNQEWLCFGGFGEEDGYSGFKKIMSAADRPEFILTATFPVALGAIRAARDMGIQIPQEVEIMGFGNNQINRFLSTPICYIDQPTAELGRRAFALTLENIRSQEHFKPQHIQLPTRLVLCDGCRRSDPLAPTLDHSPG